MKTIFLTAVLALLSTFTTAQQTLEQLFQSPPPEARPRTWFHAMSGNMSEAGLTKDLEAMAEAGIGGVILFNVTHSIPKGNVLFNSDEHTRLTVHAAQECERLGLSFGLHNCDGWTSSGGPWITPENSMKIVVHSQTIVDGGPLNLSLPQPTTREGLYQDIGVIAYPSLKSEIIDAQVSPKITSSDPELDFSIITDGRADARSQFTVPTDRPGWIQLDFGAPHTIRTLHLAMHKKINQSGKKMDLLTSDDGENFKKHRTIKIKRLGKTENAFYETFPEGLTARYFRMETEGDYELMEVKLSNTLLFPEMLARYSIHKRLDVRIQPLKESPPEMTVAQDQIVDLTASLSADGQLRAQLPQGKKWTILRFGYTSTAAVNSPASDEGRGLEADKMSRRALKVHYDAYCGKVIKAAKNLAPNALQYMEIDSYEVGGQNWTENYHTLFQKKFGYDLLKHLPLYAGRFLENAQTTDRILYDIRDFNSQLMVENYFDYFTELCHADGLISYVEPYSFNASFNEIDAGRNVDITMGEFWMHGNFKVESAVSAAHIYGKPIVSAEAFSAFPEINWHGHPGLLKKSGDLAWTTGINEFMFHRFAHQANTHVTPGMTMSQWGSHIDRTQTWWDTAGKSWFQYLARGQSILRQGIPVKDLLVFVGDGASADPITKRSLRNLPDFISFDSINPHALLTRVQPENGKLVFPNGTTYHALLLRNTRNMRLPTLRKLDELSAAGVPIVGSRPGQLAGYGVTEDQRREFNKLARKVWKRSNIYGPNKWPEIIEAHNLTADLLVRDEKPVPFIHKKTATADIYFISNQEDKAKTYHCDFKISGKQPEFWDPMTGDILKSAWFSEKNGRTQLPLHLEAHQGIFVIFQNPAEKPALTIKSDATEQPSATFTDQGRAILQVSENGTYEIDTKGRGKRSINVTSLPATPTHIKGPWTVKFDQTYGYDGTLTFNQLIDWKDHPKKEVRHYSGPAYYHTTFNLTKDDLRADRRFEIDLGEVHIAAAIGINDKPLGTLWKAPYRLDVTEFLKEGENKLSIKAVNLWTNRLIGDLQLPDSSGYDIKDKRMVDWYTQNLPQPQSQRHTFTVYPFQKKNDPLTPSGLLGPVRLLPSKTIPLN